MKIDLDNLLSMAEAAELITEMRGGNRVARMTPWRWAKYGVNGVYLDAVRLGTQYFTTREAIEKFAHESMQAERERAAAAQDDVTAVAKRVKRRRRSGSDRARAVRDAEREAASLGI